MVDKKFIASLVAVAAGVLAASGVVQVGEEEQQALVEAAGAVLAGVASIITVVRGVAARRRSG